MEDLPRIPEKSDDTADKSELPVPHVESLMSRWQKMIESNKGMESKDDDDDDDEDDEDLDSSTIGNARGKRKSKKLGHTLRAFMPQAEKVTDSDTEVKPIETIDADQNDLQLAPQGSLQDYTEQRLFQDNGAEPNREEAVQFEGIEIAPSEPETSVNDPSNNEMPSTTVEQVVTHPMPEPESIQQILQRQEEIRAANLPFIHNPDTTGTIDLSSSQPAKSNEVYTRSPTGALLAIDAANYLSARHRDKKNMKKVDSEFSKVRREQSKQNDELDSRLLRQEKQHNQYIPKPEKLKERPLIKLESRIDKNDNKKVEKITSNEKIKVIPAEINPEVHQYNTPNVRVELSPEKRRLGFEETLHKISEVGTGNIKSEFEFERRHEVMDEPGGSAGMKYGEVSPEFDHVAQITQRSSISSDSTSKPVHVLPSKTSSDATYKQAAATGFWGAVVGIIVFIIIYMLSRG